MSDIKLQFVILSAEPEKNNKYILSCDKNEIVLPCVELEKAWFDTSLDHNIIVFLKHKIVSASEYELIPQIIKINLDKNNIINIIYGFVITPSTPNENYHWLAFNHLQPNEYTTLIFETIQKLR